MGTTLSPCQCGLVSSRRKGLREKAPSSLGCISEMKGTFVCLYTLW